MDFNGYPPGGGPQSGPFIGDQFLANDKSQTQPGFGFVNNPTAGLYYDSNNSSLKLVQDNKVLLSANEDGVTTPQQFIAGDVSEGKPGFGFSSNSSAGLYYDSNDESLNFVKDEEVLLSTDELGTKSRSFTVTTHDGKTELINLGVVNDIGTTPEFGRCDFMDYKTNDNYFKPNSGSVPTVLHWDTDTGTEIGSLTWTPSKRQRIQSGTAAYDVDLSNVTNTTYSGYNQYTWKVPAISNPADSNAPVQFDSPASLSQSNVRSYYDPFSYNPNWNPYSSLVVQNSVNVKTFTPDTTSPQVIDPTGLDRILNDASTVTPQSDVMVYHTLGYEVRVLENFKSYGIGITDQYDFKIAGIIIGVFGSDGTLLGQTIVTDATPSYQTSGGVYWKYVAWDTPLYFKPGDLIRVCGSIPTDSYIYNGITVAHAGTVFNVTNTIVFSDSAAGSTETLLFPNNTSGSSGWAYGPSVNLFGNILQDWVDTSVGLGHSTYTSNRRITVTGDIKSTRNLTCAYPCINDSTTYSSAVSGLAASTVALIPNNNPVVAMFPLISNNQIVYDDTKGTFTVKFAGWYVIGAIVNWAWSGGNGSRWVWATINGATFTDPKYASMKQAPAIGFGSTPGDVSNPSDFVYLAAGDVVRWWLYQNDGMDINVFSDTTSFTRFKINLVWQDFSAM